MGYAIMPKLEEPTVCEIPCVHVDCVHLRKFVKHAKCNICNSPIISGERYYAIENDELQHFRCVTEKIK